MFRHVSLIKLTDTSTMPAIFEELAKLPRIIPALRDYKVGPDAGLADDNFDFAVVADCDDIAGYESYRDNEAHQRILKEMIRPVLAQRAAVQYEC